MRANRRIVLVLMALALLAAVAVKVFADQSLARVQGAGTLRIGYAVEAPYTLVQPGGAVSGEFPETARQIIQTLGITHVEWIQTNFDALIPELEAGRFDVIAAGMYITPERAQRVAFSEPLLHVQQGLLVQAGNPNHITAYQYAVDHPSIRLAVVVGAVEETLLRRMGVPDEQIVIVPDARTGLAALESGVADGLALSAPTIRWMATHDLLGKTMVAQPFSQPDPAFSPGIGYTGFAFRRADLKLRDAWNVAQQRFLRSPRHLEIMAAFGFEQAELPEPITTEEVLAQ